MKKLEPFIPKRLEFAGNRDPDLRQDRDSFLAVSSFWISPDRQLIPEPIPQSSDDVVSRISGKSEVRRVLQPFKPDALAETDHPFVAFH